MGLLDDIHGKEPTPAPGAPPAPERRPETRHGVQLELKEERVLLTAGESKAFPLIVRNTGTEPDVIRFKIDLLTESQEKGGAEWTVKFAGVDPKAWEPTFSKDFERELELISGGEREITMSVVCPRGARYGDQLKVLVNVTSKGDPAAGDTKTVSATARQAVLAVKTSIGYERGVADSIAARAKAKDIGIFSILAPDNLRGYIFVESMNPDRLEEIARSIRRARGVVRGEAMDTSLDAISHYLTPKPLVSGIMEGDIVELVAGPFKGEKARVQKIDEAKEEITVELFEAMVPIPVTVRGDHVRVLAKEEK